MPKQTFQFHRPELAADLIKMLEGGGLLDARTGLFLAAPRRTGKSTFLREDLIPAIKAQGWLPIYVDLWSDRSRDPALLISGAIQKEIQHQSSIASRILQATGLKKVKVAGVAEFELGSHRASSEITLPDLLSEVSNESKKPICLLIDEAQHALNSPAGVAAMFALKAARDQLQGRLSLVLTGSHRDKLAHLVIKKDQPFFGAQVSNFPLLGRAFSDAYADWVNQQLATGHQFSEDDMWKAFEMVGNRPEMLATLVKDVAFDLGKPAELGSLLQMEAKKFRSQIWADMESDYQSLNPLQKAILAAMAEAGPGFSPYHTKLDKPVTAQQIQTAIEGLRDRNWIWKSARGAYALEDSNFIQWYSLRNK